MNKFADLCAQEARVTRWAAIHARLIQRRMNETTQPRMDLELRVAGEKSHCSPSRATSTRCNNAFLAVRKACNKHSSAPLFCSFPFFFLAYYVIGRARAFITSRATPLDKHRIRSRKIFYVDWKDFQTWKVRFVVNRRDRKWRCAISKLLRTNVNVSILDPQDSRHLQLPSKMRAKSIKSSPSTCGSPQNPHPLHLPPFEKAERLKREKNIRDQRHLLDPLDKKIAGWKLGRSSSSRGGGEDRDHGRTDVEASPYRPRS